MSQIKSDKRQRFAIYTRYSSEMQNDLSLEAQENLCRQEIARRGGAIVKVYSDSAKSGWSLDREGFNELQRDASRGRFDALMLWKFDRLARNHDHAVMIKALLRHEFGMKLHCVDGFSEDDDAGAYGAMMEQMIAVFSAFYSRNLSTETKRGKRQRALNGEFNGSVAPLGYDLIKAVDVTDKNQAGLVINPAISPIILEAFTLYATGEYTDLMIAQFINEQPIIQKMREGQKPVGKETVRDLLQNRLYTGRVPYAETFYTGTLGQGRKTTRNRKEWFEGKHDAIIPDDLFDQCQLVRQALSETIGRRPKQTYLLNDRVYCVHCLINKPHSLADANYGKMRVSNNKRDNNALYRCIARDRGYHKCEQPSIDSQVIDEQVVSFLRELVIPAGVDKRISQAVLRSKDNRIAQHKINELTEKAKRIDYSWESGFISPEEYEQKRNQLVQEIESLRPVDIDMLNEAHDLIKNFGVYWDECNKVDNPIMARKQLLSAIIRKVLVYDKIVVGIALYEHFGVIVDQRPQLQIEISNELRVRRNQKGWARAHPKRERRDLNPRSPP
jgi:site-specific DNA recombinase